MEISIFKYFFGILFLWINNGVPNTNSQFPTESLDLDYNNTGTVFTKNPSNGDESSTNYPSTDDLPILTPEEISTSHPDLRNFNTRIERNVQDELFLDCTDVAIDNNAEAITWYKDDVCLMNFDPNNRIKRCDWSLRILNIQKYDAGEYTCALETRRGNFKFTFEVRVFDRPEITITPEKITLKVGESASFRCKSSSKIPSFIEWYPGVNLNEVSSMADLTQEQYEKVKINEDNPEVFEIQNVALTDQGWYSCLGRNGLNTVNASVYLEVTEVSGSLEMMTIIEGTVIFLMIPLLTIVAFRKKRHLLVFFTRKFYL